MSDLTQYLSGYFSNALIGMYIHKLSNDQYIFFKTCDPQVTPVRPQMVFLKLSGEFSFDNTLALLTYLSKAVTK